MSKKLAEYGTFKIEESEIFAADFSCYKTPLAFAEAVAEKIESDPDWYVIFKPESIAERVTTSYMRYRRQSDEYEDEGYYLHDRATPEERIIDRFQDREVFQPNRFDIKIWYVNLENMPLEARIVC